MTSKEPQFFCAPQIGRLAIFVSCHRATHWWLPVSMKSMEFFETFEAEKHPCFEKGDSLPVDRSNSTVVHVEVAILEEGKYPLASSHELTDRTSPPPTSSKSCSLAQRPKWGPTGRVRPVECCSSLVNIELPSWSNAKHDSQHLSSISRPKPDPDFRIDLGCCRFTC